MTNYRPTSILSHIPKIFESLVLGFLLNSVNPILANEQHCFRPGRSTSTCNLTFCNYTFNAFREGKQVDVIYTDFAKAFDLVNHELLIAVLKAYGSGEPLLSWFNSFLINQAQCLKLFNTKSEVFRPSSGVPQGGHLSPLLFLLFVNSACSSLKHCQLLCFADDMKLFLKISAITDCFYLQDDLDNFVAWSESLGLSLNINKCRFMTFTRRRTPISFSYTINGTNLFLLSLAYVISALPFLHPFVIGLISSISLVKRLRY